MASNFNDTTPAAPASARNVKWQTDGAGNDSAYVVDMVGDSGSGGADGLVPAPPSGSAAAGKFLKANGTWAVPTSPWGGVSTKTADYNVLSSDDKTLVVLLSGSHTFTLPNPAPSSTFAVFFENAGTGTLTISRNSLTIDGAASNLSLTQNQGVVIFSDGTNYFTERGMAAGGGGGAPTTDTYLLGTQDFANLPNSAANPSAFYGPDTQPTSAGGFDDEFPGSSLSGSWTVVNAGSSTHSVSNSMLLIKQPTHSGDNMVLFVKNKPGSTPYTLTAKMHMMPSALESSGFAILGLVFYDSGSGKIVRFDLGQSGVNSNIPEYSLDGLNFNSTSSFNSTLFTSKPWIPLTGEFWLAIEDDGTNFLFSVSNDGVQFIPIFSGAKSSTILSGGYDKAGIVIDAGNSANGDCYGSCEYIRQT